MHGVIHRYRSNRNKPLVSVKRGGENGGPGDPFFGTLSTKAQPACRCAMRPGSSSEEPILAPRALSPKWTFSIYPAHHGSWYIQGCVANRPSSSPPYSSSPSKLRRLLSFQPDAKVINVPPLQPRPVPPRPYWTEPLFREETSARREKFRKIGSLPSNHKPKTKKVIATAKRLWDKYVICGCRLCLRGVTVRTADGVLSGIVSILCQTFGVFS